MYSSGISKTADEHENTTPTAVKQTADTVEPDLIATETEIESLLCITLLSACITFLSACVPVSSADTVESNLIATEMVAFPSKSSRNNNDSDPVNGRTTPI